jgi:hypothetical protein
MPWIEMESKAHPSGVHAPLTRQAVGWDEMRCDGWGDDAARAKGMHHSANSDAELRGRAAARWPIGSLHWQL